MDDTALVRMSNRVANVEEEVETFLEGEPASRGVGGDGESLDELHHEVRAAIPKARCIENAGHERVIQCGQGLALVLESSEHRCTVEVVAHHLDGHQATGLGLLGMQERASMVGGRLSIESQKDKGTTVRVEIPVEGGRS